MMIVEYLTIIPKILADLNNPFGFICASIARFEMSVILPDGNLSGLG